MFLLLNSVIVTIGQRFPMIPSYYEKSSTVRLIPYFP